MVPGTSQARGRTRRFSTTAKWSVASRTAQRSPSPNSVCSGPIGSERRVSASYRLTRLTISPTPGISASMRTRDTDRRRGRASRAKKRCAVQPSYDHASAT